MPFSPLFAIRQSVPLSSGLDVEGIEAKDGTRCDQVEFLSNTQTDKMGRLEISWAILLILGIQLDAAADAKTMLRKETKRGRTGRNNNHFCKFMPS